MSVSPNHIEKMLRMDRRARSNLAGGELATDTTAFLRGKRDEIVAALLRYEPVLSRIEAPDKALACSQLVDLAIAANDQSNETEQFALPWVMVVQQLQKFSRAESVHALLSYALAAVAPVLGARMSTQAHLGLLCLSQLDAVGQLRSGMVRNSSACSVVVCEELRRIQTQQDWSGVDFSKLENLLASMLESWTNTRVNSPLAAELAYVRLFIERVVCVLEAPQSLWELLLAKLDRYQSANTEKIYFCALSSATECLLAAIPRFDFFRIAAAEYALQRGSSGVARDLLFIKLAFDARPAGELSIRFHRAIEPSALADADAEFANEMAANAGNKLIEVMRSRVERVQLDWLSEAWHWLTRLAQLSEEAASAELQTEQALTRLASQLVEAAGDAQSFTRLKVQLSALLREAVISAAIVTDPIRARERYRIRVAPFLDLERDPTVWRKFRQIGAGLGQLDISGTRAGDLQSRTTQVLAATAEIAKEILRERYLAAATPGEPPRVSRLLSEGDTDALGLAAVVGLRLHGENAVSFAASSFVALLASRRNVPPATALRDGLHRVSDATLQRDEAVSKVLRDLSDRAAICRAAAALPACINEIAADVSIAGASTYAKNGRSILIAGTSIPITNAWELGVADNTFTLSRVAFIAARGDNNVTADLSFWWSTVLAKRISRVPRDFMAHNLQILLLVLLTRFSTDEAFSIFRAVSSLYITTFGVKLRNNSPRPDLYAPLTVCGEGWLKAFGPMAAPTPQSISQAAENALNLAPEMLVELGEVAFESTARQGDQEWVWARLHPHFFALMEASSPATMEAEWLAWEDRVLTQLAVSQAAYALQILRDGHMTLQNIALGRCFILHEVPITDYLTAKLGGSVLPIHAGGRTRHEAIKIFLLRIGATLLSEPTSLAYIAVARHMMAFARELALHDANSIERFWLAIDEGLRPLLGTAELAAFNRLLAQTLMTAEGMGDVLDFVGEALLGKEHFFCDASEEERLWREALGGLLVAAATPDFAPMSGQMLLRRVVLSANMVGGKSAQDWKQVKDVLDQRVGGALTERFRERFVARTGQATSALGDLARFADAGALESPHLWGAAFAGVADCQLLWRLASFVAQTESKVAANTHSEAFVDSITRTGVPTADICSRLATQLAALQRSPIPVEFKRKRLLLSATRYTLGEITARSVDRALWVFCISRTFYSDGAMMHGFEQLGGSHPSGANTAQVSNLAILLDPKVRADSGPGASIEILNEFVVPLERYLKGARLFGQRAHVESILTTVFDSEPQSAAQVAALWFHAASASAGYTYKLPDHDVGRFLRDIRFGSAWARADAALIDLLPSSLSRPGQRALFGEV